ncbi:MULTISPECIES: SDR family oxidoreductase [unclassified Burkholderia]|uniref:SDR family oxidoreductase n=1 Tax=unclassified Burkholderia TaxID=2613784 RepID=UPI002AAF5EBF|nr:MULTISPECIES: SDR family oxidoreductase [unclassified Burkholderia]
MEISNTVAVVTGADSALGNAVALLLESRGAKVARLATDSAAPHNLPSSSSHLSFAVSITDPRSVEAAFRHIEATLGPPRILVNCHEYCDQFPIAEADYRNNVSPCSLERCERVITSNLVGIFDILRLFAASAASLPPNQGGERGVIINTALETADDGAVNEAALAAAAGGRIAMTLPLARELGRYGIRVLSVIASSFAEPAADEDQLVFSIERAFPERPGEPREFAELIAALITNPMMNGTSVRIDGGGRMKPANSGMI